MKKYGFLHTFFPVEDQSEKKGKAPKNPLDNFIVIFHGPVGTDAKEQIREHIQGASQLETELWKEVVEILPFGERAVHYAVLDYFLEKYGLDLRVVCHGDRIVPGNPSRHVYETTLHGNWVPKPHILFEIEM